MELEGETTMNLHGRDFLTLLDYTPEEIAYLLDLAAELKAKKKAGIPHKLHEGKNIALIFEKTSTRTRCSFEVAGIITHNEERNIGRCLESLRDVADEVIVVDSGSTDATEAICQQAGARFERHDWEGYSAQKNYANSLASCPWILSIDADEALSPELRQSLLRWKQEETQPALFSFNRLTNYCGHWIHHCGWYPDKVVRVFPAGAARWDGLVHEKLVTNPSDLPAHPPRKHTMLANRSANLVFGCAPNGTLYAITFSNLDFLMGMPATPSVACQPIIPSSSIPSYSNFLIRRCAVTINFPLPVVN